MSSGPSAAKENPLSGESSCIEETPRSSKIAEALTVVDPDFDDGLFDDDGDGEEEETGGGGGGAKTPSEASSSSETLPRASSTSLKGGGGGGAGGSLRREGLRGRLGECPARELPRPRVDVEPDNGLKLFFPPQAPHERRGVPSGTQGAVNVQGDIFEGGKGLEDLGEEDGDVAGEVVRGQRRQRG